LLIVNPSGLLTEAAQTIPIEQSAINNKLIANTFAAYLVCNNKTSCGVCESCKLAAGGSHPDIITVLPEKKQIGVDDIRQVIKSISIKPYMADKKVVIIPDADGITPEAQNALLKVLEEPPPYGAFLLLSATPERLLPTIRSRCTELNLQALSPGEMAEALQQAFPDTPTDERKAAAVRSGGYLGQAKKILSEAIQSTPQTEEFVRAFSARDSLGIATLLASMEKWKRDKFMEEMTAWSSLLRGALVCRSGQSGATEAEQALGAARSARELMNAYYEIQKAMQYASGNVSVAALCGALLWKLR